ncbi:hypothetical protein H4R34_000183 [Dimargaris verticillata]|uniref:Uncharacterized protein n=1 Tax=Dimargaris verticillata TaxID=2761393 RepID=A0A9W8B789_9FUNG|nr:hypothetical protein H4R34_000183 [Dimargaris verticillata]
MPQLSDTPQSTYGCPFLPKLKPCPLTPDFRSHARRSAFSSSRSRAPSYSTPPRAETKLPRPSLSPRLSLPFAPIKAPAGQEMAVSSADLPSPTMPKPDRSDPSLFDPPTFNDASDMSHVRLSILVEKLCYTGHRVINYDRTKGCVFTRDDFRQCEKAGEKYIDNGSSNKPAYAGPLDFSPELYLLMKCRIFEFFNKKDWISLERARVRFTEKQESELVDEYDKAVAEKEAKGNGTIKTPHEFIDAFYHQYGVHRSKTDKWFNNAKGRNLTERCRKRVNRYRERMQLEPGRLASQANAAGDAGRLPRHDKPSNTSASTSHQASSCIRAAPNPSPTPSAILPVPLPNVRASAAVVESLPRHNNSRGQKRPATEQLTRLSSPRTSRRRAYSVSYIHPGVGPPSHAPYQSARHPVQAPDLSSHNQPQPSPTTQEGVDALLSFTQLGSSNSAPSVPTQPEASPLQAPRVSVRASPSTHTNVYFSPSPSPSPSYSRRLMHRASSVEPRHYRGPRSAQCDSTVGTMPVVSSTSQTANTSPRIRVTSLSPSQHSYTYPCPSPRPLPRSELVLPPISTERMSLPSLRRTFRSDTPPAVRIEPREPILVEHANPVDGDEGWFNGVERRRRLDRANYKRCPNSH